MGTGLMSKGNHRPRQDAESYLGEESLPGSSLLLTNLKIKIP